MCCFEILRVQFFVSLYFISAAPFFVMLIFKDLFSDSEVLSDAFSIKDAVTDKPVVFEGKSHEQIDSPIIKVCVHFFLFSI